MSIDTYDYVCSSVCSNTKIFANNSVKNSPSIAISKENNRQYIIKLKHKIKNKNDKNPLESINPSSSHEQSELAASEREALGARIVAAQFNEYARLNEVVLFNSALRDNLANGDTYLSRGSIAGIIVAGRLAIDTETIKSISLAFK